MISECKVNFRCFKCDGNHRIAICTFNPGKNDKTDKNNDSKNQVDETNNNYASSSLQVLKNSVQTARADVYSTDEKFTGNARILFDSTAQLNYISPHACQELQLIPFTKKEISVKTFGKGVSLKSMDVVKVVVKLKNSDMKILTELKINLTI